MASSFKLFWNIHKWTGVVIAVVITITAVTGFLLLIKKKVDWVEAPTQTGAPGEVGDLITMQAMFAVVLGSGHADFKTIDDVDRVDFRPGDRVFKVRSKRNYAEIQLFAVTGEILSVDWRASDLFEAIHDGSFWGAWWHDWVMPAVAVALAGMVVTGL